MFPNIIRNTLEKTSQAVEKTSNALFEKTSNEAPHIVFLSTTTAFTIPLGELARQLVVERGFTGTFISVAHSKNRAQAAFLESLPTAIAQETISSLPFGDLLPSSSIEQQVVVMAERCVSLVVPILEKLVFNKRPAALVVDFVVAFAIVDIAKMLRIPCYVFATTNMTALSYSSLLPEIENKIKGKFSSLTEPLSIPGCIPINAADILEGAMDGASESFKALQLIFSKYKYLDGILVNSCVELEPGPFKALKEKESKGELPPIYPIGPVVSREGWGDSNAECLKWLNNQPKGSVIYIASGSGGTLTHQQTTELAYGLEQSGLRFLWVVRPTIDKNGIGGMLFDLMYHKDPLSSLPNGFIERTKDRGMVVPFWAPQVHVLKHEAIGGFITHCGWSSVLESISFGVPMIAWPFSAEQRMNAVLLSVGEGSIEAALRQFGDNGIVHRNEVVYMGKELIDGEEGARVRENVKKVQALTNKAIGEGGSAHEALAKWCEKIAA